MWKSGHHLTKSYQRKSIPSSTKHANLIWAYHHYLILNLPASMFFDHVKGHWGHLHCQRSSPALVNPISRLILLQSSTTCWTSIIAPQALPPNPFLANHSPAGPPKNLPQTSIPQSFWFINFYLKSSISHQEWPMPSQSCKQANKNDVA